MDLSLKHFQLIAVSTIVLISNQFTSIVPVEREYIYVKIVTKFLINNIFLTPINQMDRFLQISSQNSKSLSSNSNPIYNARSQMRVEYLRRKIILLLFGFFLTLRNFFFCLVLIVTQTDKFKINGDGYLPLSNHFLYFFLSITVSFESII